MRFLLGAIGGGLVAWGAWLLLPQITIELLAWLGGGVVLHDLLIAPLVGASGFVIRRASIGVGLAVSGVVGLLAIPLLWRDYGGPVNPGLHDRSYATGVAVVLAVIWTAVALHEVVTRLRQRGRSEEDDQVVP